MFEQFISYDYSEFLKELEEELMDGSLSNFDEIQILRSNEVVCGRGGSLYRPILDWFYSDETMQNILMPDPFDAEDELTEKEILRDDYNKVKSKLWKVKVIDVITEMQQFNRILG